MRRTFRNLKFGHGRASAYLRNWVLAAALGLFAVACGKDATTAANHDGTMAGPQLLPGDDPDAPAFNNTGECMVDDVARLTKGGPTTCTANDTRIAEVLVLGGSGTGGVFLPGVDPPIVCTEETIELTLAARLIAGSNSDRADMGAWVALDGGDARTGQCNHYILPPGSPGTVNDDDPEPDSCAGMVAGTEALINLGTLTLPCVDDNDDGNLDLSGCLAWDVPGQDGVCPDDRYAGDPPGTEDDYRAATIPGTPAKCNCSTFQLPVTIPQFATIEVKKVCDPTDDPGTFDLLIDGSNADGNDKACGGTTGAVQVTAGTTAEPGDDHNVAEADFVTGNYFSSYACTRNGEEFTSGTGTSVSDFEVLPDDVIVCTFTNERKRVTVTKDAATSLTRKYTWEIDKVADPTTVLLDPGQVYNHPYSVEVSVAGSTDSDWLVTGNITIHNPTSGTVNVATVTDALTGAINATVECPGGLPQDLAAGEDLVCTYEASPGNGDNRTNTATATLTGVSGNFQGTAPVSFAGATITHEDNCIVVKDLGDLGDTDPLGTVCVPGTPGSGGTTEDAPHTFNYTRLVPTGEAQCGVITYNNTASGVTNTNSDPYSDSESIEVTIECPEGCTLTQGYWKTHNDLFREGQNGGPPSDDTWALVGGPGTIFFLSGQSWFEVFWTAPQGNVYYNLAHQYMAAKLNDLGGVTPSADVAQAILDAEALFGTYTPAQIAALKGKPSDKELRAEFIELAGILGSFNEGAAGTAHCTEDADSAP